MVMNIGSRSDGFNLISYCNCVLLLSDRGGNSDIPVQYIYGSMNLLRTVPPLADRANHISLNQMNGLYQPLQNSPMLLQF